MSKTKIKEPELRLYFVPYESLEHRPPKCKDGAKSVTRQQHISREYHRKARLLKANAKSEECCRTEVLELIEQDSVADSSSSSDTSSTAFSPYDRSQTPPVTPFSVLSAARYDPFDVYCKQELPMFIHEILNHHLTHVCAFFSLSTALDSINATRNHILSHAINDPLSWYTVVFAAATHYAYVHRRQPSKQAENLRLSYKTYAMQEIRADIKRNHGRASERVIFGINTLAAHGFCEDLNDMHYDPIQERKVFGTANEIHYYSSMETTGYHWSMLIKLASERGGPGTLHCADVDNYPPSPGPGCLNIMDTLNAWRELRAPIFDMEVSSKDALAQRTHKPDDAAIALSKKLTSGFDTAHFHSKEMTDLVKVIEHTRELLVDFDQHQRGGENRPAIRLLYWARMLVLCDLLRVPDHSVQDAATNPEILYHEICRISCIAFYQLVLFPIMSMNRMPEKILSRLFPMLELCIKPINGQLLIHDQPWLYFWALILGSLLAFEHYQSTGDSDLMDQMAAYFEHGPIKHDRHAWPAVKKAVSSFIWLDSECDGPGEQVWKYVCMYMTTRDTN